MTGCGTTRGYFGDRGRDAMDIVTVTGGLGIGGKLRLGPFQPALLHNTDIVGLRLGQGFAGWEATTETFVPFPMRCFGDTAPFPNCGFQMEARNRFHKDRGKCIYAYSPLPFVAKGYHAAYYTQIEAVIGLGPSIRIGFNPGELIDFILGWGMVDIFRDDIGRKHRKQ